MVSFDKAPGGRITANVTKTRNGPSVSQGVHASGGIDARKAAPKRLRFPKGSLALKEIKAIQKKSDDRVRKVAFLRLIREVSDEIRHEQSSEEPIFRWRRDAVSALQKATDALLVLLVGNLISAANHAGRDTIDDADMHYLRKVTGGCLVVRATESKKVDE